MHEPLIARSQYYVIFSDGATPAKNVAGADEACNSAVPFDADWDVAEKLLFAESVDEEVNGESFAAAAALLPLLRDAGARPPVPSKDADGDALLTWRNGQSVTTLVINSKSIGAIKTKAGRPVFISKKQPIANPQIDFLWPIIRTIANPFQSTLTAFWNANSSVTTKKLGGRSSARACMLMIRTGSSVTTIPKLPLSSASETESARNPSFGLDIAIPS